MKLNSLELCLFVPALALLSYNISGAHIPKRLCFANLNSLNVLFKLADLFSFNIVAPCC